MAGRPRQFDTENVLEAAMHAFWAKGYEATSLADLMDATGLHKGSLYQAFGDKHTLFLQSLQHYLADMRQQTRTLLKIASTPLDGILAVSHALIDMVDTESHIPKGCMAVNALVELAPHDPDVKRILEDHLNAMRTSLEQAVMHAQDEGQITKTRPATLITSLMMTFMAGLATHMKGSVTKNQAHLLVDAQIQALI